MLPQAIRRGVDLHPGDELDARVEGERIGLIPKKRKPRTGRIIKDPLTGFPVLAACKNSPELTSEDVAEILADFPR